MAVLDPLLERRTLIAAINDPGLETPEMFFISNYWGAPKSIYSEYADIQITTGKRGLARFRQSGQSANVVGRVGQKIITVKLPFIREKKVIEAQAFNNPRALGTVYVTGGDTINQAKREALAVDLADLKTRVLRREEWMASQLLTTGKIRYADEYVSFEVDFQMPTANKPVLSGTSLWTGSASDILGNLAAWSTLIQTNTGRPGRDVIMGTSAALAFLKDATVRELLNTNNFRVGAVNADVTAADLGTYGGFNFRQHTETYVDENGDTQNYMPANMVIMLPAGFKTDRLFGIVQEVNQVFADPFFSKSWEEPDPSVLWLLAASRPLPIIEEAGSWVAATVTA